MKVDKKQLSDRLLDFAARTIKLVSTLSKTFVGRHIGGQLMRSATSAGANYEEACGAESRADFIHKMQVVLKELRESRYWLRLVEKLALIPAAKLKWLLPEVNELCNIVAKSIITAKNRK